MVAQAVLTALLLDEEENHDFFFVKSPLDLILVILFIWHETANHCSNDVFRYFSQSKMST